MTREEEIEQVVKDIARKFYNEENPELAYCSAKQGILWADQHPRKGLWDAEKVCKFLYEKVVDITYLNEDNTNEHYDKDEFIEDLRKAMEE